jgi:hypothetical protein
MDLLSTFPTNNLLTNILVLVAAVVIGWFLLRILLRVAFRFVAIGCFVIVAIGVVWLIFHFLR